MDMGPGVRTGGIYPQERMAPADYLDVHQEAVGGFRVTCSRMTSATVRGTLIVGSG
jgi:hypothetical protein